MSDLIAYSVLDEAIAKVSPSIGIGEAGKVGDPFILLREDNDKAYEESILETARQAGKIVTKIEKTDLGLLTAEQIRFLQLKGWENCDYSGYVTKIVGYIKEEESDAGNPKR